MLDHPRFDELRKGIRNASEHTGAWAGSVFRAVEVEWARPEYLVSGEGTRRHGGRWMRARTARVVHGASTEALALRESRAAFAYYGIRKPQNNPRVTVEIALRLQAVLNLIPVEAAFPNLTADELLAEDWEKVNGRGRETLAQATGRAAWDCGLEGILVPSARDRRSRNLIWFPDNLRSGSSCKICGRKALERWIAE